MANNLKVFNNYNDYETADLIKPAVSLVVSDNSVHYDPIEPTPPTPTFQGKWLATYQNGHTDSAECNSTSAISRNEITLTNLVSVELGNCVTSIGGGAFSGCYSLTSVTIPNSVTYIDYSAFFECRSLTSIDIPSGVTSIGNNAFNGCISLTSITIPSGVTSIGQYAFASCGSLTNIDIPNSVTSISFMLFAGCSSLTSCTIGSGVTSIGGASFQNCTGLAGVTIKATTPPTLAYGVFNSTNNCPIYVPAASVNAYKSASGWSAYASRIQAIP